jgi:LPS O-antigen subunit length determinant protein (WzzB/FepE family)
MAYVTATVYSHMIDGAARKWSIRTAALRKRFRRSEIVSARASAIEKMVALTGIERVTCHPRLF